MKHPQVIVISGGDGSSGERLSRTALAQFPGREVEVIVNPGVRTPTDLERSLDQASQTGAIVVHTFVDAAMRSRLAQVASERGVTALDAMGPLLEALSVMLGAEPVGIPGRYRKIREEYFQRVEAIEFAVRHDDGRHVSEMGRADIVLIGVSRSGKTPLSMYLAMRGHKTANVPLIEGVEPPTELFAIDRRRVVELTIDPEVLVAYRRRRQRSLGTRASTSYSDPRQILRELEFARDVTRRGRFASIDVSLKPIEESASEVLSVVGR